MQVSSAFLLAARRLTVGVSRARRKMIPMAAESLFTLLRPGAEASANALLPMNRLLRTCPTLLWGGREGVPVKVWGGAR